MRGLGLGGLTLISALMLLTGAPTAQAAVPACSVTWTGAGPNALWSTPANWSTGKVPTATSDVCVNTFTFVQATPPISVHSLQLLGGATPSINFTGGPAGAQIKIATLFRNEGSVVFGGSYDVSAGSILNPGEITSLDDTSLVSPHFSNTGTVAIEGGRLAVPDNPAQLANGTLSAGEWLIYGGLLVLPQDIVDISGASVNIARAGSGIDDPSGHNALAGLSAIGSGGTLAVAEDGSLALSGNLVSQGTVQLGAYDGPGSLSVAGTYTQESGAQANLSQSTLTAKHVVIDSGAGIVASGTLAAPVTNDGALEAILTLKVLGNYVQGSAATFSSYFNDGTLEVQGQAQLAGTLNVVFNRDCPPDPGQHYDAVTFSSHTGAFAQHTSGFGLTFLSHALEVTAQ